MRKIFLNVLIAVVAVSGMFVGCTHSDNPTAPCKNTPVTADSSALLSFAHANGITPVPDPTGLYYQIISQGSGPALTASSIVNVTYTGTLLNGTIFDSTTNSAKTGFQIGSLIPAWQVGLPKIQAGGRIKLLVPSALGYGCTGAAPAIPSNAPLYFDLTVVSAK
jgi:FKBP-type peptidyl-prolyl cis-trans isomerase FkpA